MKMGIWSGLPAHIEDKIIPEPNSGCWLWLGSQGKYGHGIVRRGRQTTSAQKYVYEYLVDEVPQGLLLDHFWCTNPPCVNPEHVRPASYQENTLRSDITIATNFLIRTCCAKGHEFTIENTGYEKRSRARICLTCKNYSIKAWRETHKSKSVEYSTNYWKRNRTKVASARREREKRKRDEHRLRAS